MPKFRVIRREIHVQGVLVEAGTPEQAVEIVREGGGELDEAHFEYSHTMSPDSWTVEVEDDDMWADDLSNVPITP